MLTKNCSYIRGIYFFVCTFCSALMLMEVPKIVFYAPLIVFILFVADRIITKEDFNFDIASGFLFLFIFVYVYFTYSDSSSLYYQSYIHIHAFFYYFIGINFLKGYSNEEKKQFIEASLIIISVIYIVYVVLTLLNYELFTDADLKLRDAAHLQLRGQQLDIFAFHGKYTFPVSVFFILKGTGSYYSGIFS